MRIVLAEPAETLRPTGARETLERLAPGTEVVCVRSAAGCRDELRGGRVDLVVLDLRLGDEAQHVLEDRAPGGPPVVALLESPSESLALEAFRRGAADCVAAGADFEELLSAAVLEQLRRWRTTREQSRLRQNLIELRSYNEHIIDNMNSALLVVDREGIITHANPLAERIAGNPSGELPGRPVWELFPDSAPEEVPIARSLTEGVRLRGVEAVLARPGGERIPIGMSCSPMSDARGRPLGAVVLFQDLSDLKQLERQVSQSEKLASIGQLAAGVAHEINNPMGFIHANLAQMSEYVADLRRLWEAVLELRKAMAEGDAQTTARSAEKLERLDAELDSGFLFSDLAKAVRESQEGSERIRHIVQDLRAFSHDRAEASPSDLNRCLDSTANIAWTMMKHTVELDKDYAELPLVTCHPRQLQQVFMNLIVNAAQAIEAGAASGAGAPRGRITLRTRCEGEQVVISVSDSGVGIPPEHLDRIFDPFFTTKEVGEGMGLGLSTSYDIVRRHGGTLSVSSTAGRGACFEIRLPQQMQEVSE
ncbi:MAG: ATP-binding protein [Myxococcota bacterium]